MAAGGEETGRGRSGNGWVRCALGHEHWGRFGAAGLLLRSDLGPHAQVLLQHRVGWSHHGGTWGIPGGARDEHETAVTAALREAAEETSVDPPAVRLEAALVDDHGGWAYTTVVATATGPLSPEPRGPESEAVAWVATQQVPELPLHPGFAATWPRLRTVAPAPVLVIDAANTIGSRPDGWWKDRAGAVARLRDDLAVLAVAGSDQVPGATPGLPVFPELVLVAEGVARGVSGTAAVRVVAAPGSGDDAVVSEVARQPDQRPVVVVTADRELRDRVRALGAEVLGPRALLDLLG